MAQEEPISLERHRVTIEQHEARMKALSTYLDALDAAWLKVKDVDYLHTGWQYESYRADAEVEYQRKLAEIKLLNA